MAGKALVQRRLLKIGHILETRNDRARLVAYSPRTLDHQAWPRRADARSVARAVGAELTRSLEREPPLYRGQDNVYEDEPTQKENPPRESCAKVREQKK